MKSPSISWALLVSFYFIFFRNYTVFFGFLGCLRYDSKRVFAIFEVKWTFQCHLVWVILGLVGIRCCSGWNMYRCLCTLLCLLDRNLVFDKLYSVVVWVASCKQTCPALKYLLKGFYTTRAFFDKKSSTMYVSAKHLVLKKNAVGYVTHDQYNKEHCRMLPTMFSQNERCLQWHIKTKIIAVYHDRSTFYIPRSFP